MRNTRLLARSMELALRREARTILVLFAVVAALGQGAGDSHAQSDIAVTLTPGAMDYGWNGNAHGIGLLRGAGMTLRSLNRCDDDLSICTSNSDCASGVCTSTCDLPSGDCEMSGPIGVRRCARDLNLCKTNADCFGLTCERPVSPPIPVIAANTPICITGYADGDIGGTYDPVSGESALSGKLRWRVYLGASLEMPCPRCGTPSQNPKVGDQFVCEHGQRNEGACTVHAVSQLFGGVSYDCPPITFYGLSGSGLRIRLPELTTGATARQALIPCVANNVCSDDGSVCSTNADCLRCTDDLTPCTNNGDCSSGTCTAAPEQPISCGFFCHCGFCNENLDAPCFSDADCDAGETCTAEGGAQTTQDQPNACSDLVCGRAASEKCCSAGEPNCPVPTTRIGHCSLKPVVSCDDDDDCVVEAGGSCLTDDRPCFEHVITRTGAASPLGSHCVDDPNTTACGTNGDCAVGACVDETTEPTYVALTCVGQTASGAVNSGYGIPGPAAFAFSGAGGTVMAECGNGIVEIGEECDGGDCCTPSCLWADAATPCTDDGYLCTDDVCNTVGECDPVADVTNDPTCTTTTVGGGTTTTTTTTTLPGDGDVDGDGIPNAEDPCTNIGDHDIAPATVLVSRINKNTRAGDDGFFLRGDFVIPTTPFSNLDPTATGVRLLIYAAAGDLLTDVSIPPGAPWQRLGGGDRLLFEDRTGAHNGIRRFQLRASSGFFDTLLRVSIRARRGTYPVTAGDEPIRVTVVVGNGATGNCGDTRFVSSECAFSPLANWLTCRR